MSEAPTIVIHLIDGDIWVRDNVQGEMVKITKEQLDAVIERALE